MFYRRWWIIVYLFCTAMKMQSLKDFEVTTLTFWGHVTSSATWPLDSPWSLSCWRSMMTMRLSCMVTEIWGLEDFGVMTLTIGLGTCGFLLEVHCNHASNLHRYRDIKPQSCVQPMLRAKSLLRMPSVTWPVGGGQKWRHIWSSQYHIAYSVVYNFYGATLMIKCHL